MTLRAEDQERYARQLVIPEVGEAGQEKLARARVLVIGAGGLGSPVSFYLAAAGVGTLGIVDGDTVEISNLQRQILHSTADLGRPKAESAAEKLRALNPSLTVIPYQERVSPENVADLVRGYDLVVDAVDNFATRYLVNDVCVQLGKPLVEAGVSRWEGMLLVIAPGGPCYRCVFPEEPRPGSAPTPAQTGVMGVTPGILGVLQAAESIKFLLGQKTIQGQLLMVDLLSASFRTVDLKINPACQCHNKNE